MFGTCTLNKGRRGLVRLRYLSTRTTNPPQTKRKKENLKAKKEPEPNPEEPLSFECSITEDLEHILELLPEDKQEDIGM